MDSRPPNDPNNNGDTSRRGAKEIPHDGSQRNRQNGNSRGPQLNENGEMEVLGDMRDQPLVVALFLMGLASYLLREICVC
mmetsp:Transcript_27151/g.32094  ORF Transcript_27151/g.32094 Transcript_27151/m.32094 type:complete len:80 (-) Transcript_27151:288-527(-)